MSSNSTSSISKGTMFPPELAAEIFNKVKGHSSLAMMTTSEPIPFNGKDIFTFSLDHEIAIVGENAAKPAGGATMTPVQIRPVKVVYQSRVSDEFMLAAQEAQLDTLRAFVDGFSAKVARGLDIMAMHGVNPFDGNASSIVGNNHFDYAIPEANKIVYGHDSSAADANIEEALGKIENPTGIIMGKTIRTAVAELTTNNARKYPDFAWGATPPTLGGMKLDSNSTVEFNASKDRAIVGDFSAFRWGFAKEMPMEIIEYGDPDGSGTDLKKANQVLIRSEAYIGWAILDGACFARVYAKPLSADLTELRLGSLTLTPEFDPGVIEYTASTSNATTAVTATPEDSSAAVTLKLGGAAVTSPVTWASGENTLTAEVTNGDVSKTYTVTVTKTGA